MKYRKGPSIRHFLQDDVEDKWFSDDEEEKVETKPVQPPPNKALVDYQDSDSDSEEKEPSSVADSGKKICPISHDFFLKENFRKKFGGR